jgi:nitronate monooxygenase
MNPWPDTRILTLFGIDVPIIQAPMAGVSNAQLAIAVAQAGGLASLPCALLSVEQVRESVALFRKHTATALNLNFFCHAPPVHELRQAKAWEERFRPYATAFGLPPREATPAAPGVYAFDDHYCSLVEEIGPQVVSFHFGLPEASLLERVHATGAKVLSSATTVAEARWLAARGCDAIIAMGTEAGGHRGTFLPGELHTQAGTLALVPQIADAVAVPVIAAGGIADGRGLAAALMLGASGAQIGSAYLLAAELQLAPVYREALQQARDDSTALTNIFTGRPARAIVNRIMREVGPLAADVPSFPLAGLPLGPLRAHSEAVGSDDFTALWCGQAAHLAQALPAGVITQRIAAQALAVMGRGQRDS